MSNKTRLQTNNTTLDGYIARVNTAKDVAASLPDAGNGGSGGGSVETCTVMFGNDAPPLLEPATIYYTNGNMASATHEFDIMSGTSITVAKNTIISVFPWSSMSTTSGDCVTITQTYEGGGHYMINGDSTIIYGG